MLQGLEEVSRVAKEHRSSFYQQILVFPMPIYWHYYAKNIWHYKHPKSCRLNSKNCILNTKICNEIKPRCSQELLMSTAGITSYLEQQLELLDHWSILPKCGVLDKIWSQHKQHCLADLLTYQECPPWLPTNSKWKVKFLFGWLLFWRGKNKK